MRIKTGGKLLKVSEVINPPPSSAVFTATDQRDRAPLTLIPLISGGGNTHTHPPLRQSHFNCCY